ncbi:uncharacterized protein LOC107427260 [Ziziphus jujuba]|uniref:Uncharacterized protein LOC107427260 n=2 Tax=Ziziphus jujuba TaxID=326968 RepID=A0A6P4AF13_ZIZJJ|nr:uncharacterized protein LOC107427260 [Ziziphus jujuba]KAH7518299.1 hypothetical protein FEM48_Zijuj09G0156700 [Ziziphus jujuba var. spinosa]
MASYHVRSNSLPSRPHPVIPEFDEQLYRLRASDASSSSASTSTRCKLNGLGDLLECVERLLSLPNNQKALSQEQHEKQVDQILDGSLRLLDACNIAKDALLQTKESTQELQSIIRRKRGGNIELSSEVKKFLTSRKVVKKAIHKAIEQLKGIANNTFNKDNETIAIVSMLREVQGITLAIFESLLSFISGAKARSKLGGWSFISNIMFHNRVGEESQLNDFAKVDVALNILVSPKMKKSDSLAVENAQNQLANLELCIQDLEEGVESLFRRLIKTRVSLLNILNH